jgi:AcrR family transcriptional regulator
MTPRKANQPQLSTSRIVEAAMQLIDETGLEGHTMRALGARLGVDASTLYYHLPSKSALFSMIVDEVMAGLDLSGDDPSASTEDRLVAAAWAYRRALLVHPRALPLVEARSMRSRTQLQGVEILLGIFFEAGFSPIEATIGVNTLGQTVIGLTSVYATHHAAAEDRDDEEPYADLPQQEYPNVNRILRQSAYLGLDAEFEAAVRALVVGLLANAAAGRLIPANAQPHPIDPALIPSLHNEENTRAHGTEES